MLEWFSEQLKELAGSPLVILRLYSTRSSTSVNTLMSHSSDEEKNSSKDSPPSLNNLHDIEKQVALPIYSTDDVPATVQSGRPGVAAIIDEIVEKAEGNDRVVVARCGPDSMMQATRGAVAKNIKASGPSLELHIEQFGW
jgi:hypothetical protein